LLVFAVYPAHPAACDPAYPVILLMLAILYHPTSVLSLTRMELAEDDRAMGIPPQNRRTQSREAEGD